jgi:hypothetical protein
VVSDLPVHRETLREVPEAVFLPPRDEAAWAQQLATQHDYGRVAAATQEKIAGLYSVEKLAAAMAEIYEDALG